MGILSDTKGRRQAAQALMKHYTKLSILSYLAGIIWLCALSDSSLNSRTYFSENALLPGQVQSEYYNQNMAKRLFSELENMKKDQLKTIPVGWLSRKMTEIGLQSYVQNFTVKVPFPGRNDPGIIQGTNVYGVLRAPRIAGTEALVLSMPYRHGNNKGALALMLSLAGHFRSKSYWAKDIIFLVTEEGALGMNAWLEAYHDVPNSYTKSLPLESHSGAIQAAINLEISTSLIGRFNILGEGLNGQLPNLDLINMVDRLCRKEMIPPIIHTQEYHPGYSDMHSPAHELVSMVMMMFNQASGLPSANHGLFHRYRIEAITLRGVRESDYARFDFEEMGRVIEGIFRSLNNLLERFHQSFFFYLLPAPHRYVSIGLYMPPFCCLLLGPLVSAIVFWILAGDPSMESGARNTETLENGNKKDNKKEMKNEGENGNKKEGEEKEKEMKDSKSSQDNKEIDELVLREKVAFSWTPQQVSSVFPVVMATYIGGVVLYYSPLFGYKIGVTMEQDGLATSLVSLCCVFVVILLAPAFRRLSSSTSPLSYLYLVKCVAFVLYSVTLASIAAMNFSLAFFLAVLTIPVYLYAGPTQKRLRRVSQIFLLLLASPPSVLFWLCLAHNAISMGEHVDAGRLVTVTIDTVYHAMLSALRDTHLLGTWSFVIACLGVMPHWTLFWYIAWQ